MRFERLLRWQLGLFPASYRATRSDELEDALTEVEFTGRSALRESAALVGAALTAWRRFLNTPAGIRNSLFFGVMAWFGFVVALGPIHRLIAHERGGLSEFQFQNGIESTVAIVALCLAFLATFWSRSAAFLIGSAGIVAAALSIRVGQWQLQSALIYELRWLGVPLAAGLWLRGKRRIHWSAVALTMIPAAVLLLGPYGRAPRGTGYPYTLLRLNDFPRPYQMERVLDVPWIDVIAVLAILFVAFGPWLFPAGVAAALPAVMHLALLSLWPAVLGILSYLGVAVWVRVHWLPERRRSRTSTG